MGLMKNQSMKEAEDRRGVKHLDNHNSAHHDDNGDVVTRPHQGLLNWTDKAWLILIGDKEEWFPQSQCNLGDMEVTAPWWLWVKKGICK